ncbi:TetR/AcrR family transcriptional regulator [Allomuricauda sp. d1]|uniref:TetR/AcrR family transcriptional regulator n=1 Tax=Allomuricauda sp. d1 TaxID=3136725 RepID=UPI0031D6E2E9
MPRTKQFDEKEVLNKAMELFWERGFHATSMQDLVTHLGINRASLYDTFGSKDALFEQAFALYRSTGRQMLHRFFVEKHPVKDNFKKLLDVAIDEAINDPAKKGCFVVNVTTEMVPGNDRLHQVLLENKHYVETFFREQIQKGIAKGEIGNHVNPNSTAEAIFTFYSGLRVVAKVEPDVEKLQKMVRVVLSILD